jgi:hypothetical protein
MVFKGLIKQISPPSDCCLLFSPSYQFNGPGVAQWYSAGQGAGNFYPHHSVQTGSGAHPASYPMGTRGSSFPGGKAAVA